ncbi:MAG: inositol-3-phosphate synthase, partial [Acidobacteria bacterium]|nr:inositol-3-phosphate synthase [Acidobacteriota bacterium]
IVPPGEKAPENRRRQGQAWHSSRRYGCSQHHDYCGRFGDSKGAGEAHRLSDPDGYHPWLSFYFKSPQHAKDLCPEHDLFIQLMKLKNTLRYLRSEELITHLGLEYYD